MTAPNIETPMFTPHTVHENATPDVNEVLVAGVDANGLPQNVLLRNAPQLRARLVATPPMVPNPDHATVSAELAAAKSASEALMLQLQATPPEINGNPNPDHAALTQQAMAAATAADAIAAQLNATPPVLPNPDRTPIEQEVFAAAVQALVVADAPANEAPPA